MYNHLAAIFQFVVEQFATSWPYLLITIPLAVAVKLSGASRFINRALSAQPLGKQLKLADARGAGFAVLLGPDERARGMAVLKNLRDGSQREVKLARLSDELRAALKLQATIQADHG